MPVPTTNLGIALQMNGDRHMTIEQYRQAITIDPNSIFAQQNLAAARAAAQQP